MNITAAGIGYVGLSNAVLLPCYHNIIAYEINKDMVNNRVSPIKDNEIEAFLKQKILILKRFRTVHWNLISNS